MANLDPEPDLNARLEAILGPDPEADARAKAETVASATRAARFVSNRAGRWKNCPKRACRRARSCRGEGPPASLPPCGAKGDWRAINGLALFAVLERLHLIRRDLRAQMADGRAFGEGAAGDQVGRAASFSQRSGGGRYMV
ncbi:MAG: hypothetical protein JJ920_05900 [Roseitalea sp.]|jgi:hypothetical protein|nr:hypothetical protein [Roseitalea sp.]MBO6723939.1 hypothetical protein [Roseitalea sp.]MBO6742422.1 hypothetical protein [Roseitalea sp.]